MVDPVPLLDANVLLALAWPNHVHHRPARRWFRQARAHGWATCPLTQAAFVRVSSNRKVLPEAGTPQEALQVLRRLVRVGHHAFWEDAVPITDSPWIAEERLLGYRQVSDAHLLAIALSHGGRVATFDRGLREVVPPGTDPARAVLLLSIT